MRAALYSRGSSCYAEHWPADGVCVGQGAMCKTWRHGSCKRRVSLEGWARFRELNSHSNLETKFEDAAWRVSLKTDNVECYSAR